MSIDFAGVWAPIATPLAPSGSIDGVLLAAHAKALLAEGCRGVVVFGTTGEAPSFSVAERRDALEALLAAGLEAERVVVGSGCCARPDALELSLHAARLGVAAVLVLPPFYFKPVDEEGVFRAFAELVESCGAEAPRLLLYHFPRLSGVPISVGLAARLAGAYPGQIAGVKDSSGDPASARAFTAVGPDFAVFPGTEAALPALRGAPLGGLITAGANVHAGTLARAWEARARGVASPDETRALALRSVLDGYPMIPAVKALLAAREGSAGWERLRPPLVALDSRRRAALIEEYTAAERV